MGTEGLSIGFLFLIRCKIPIYSAIELWPIAGYNRLGYSELAHNVLSYKQNALFIFDGCECFSFYPFDEIVGGHQ